MKTWILSVLFFFPYIIFPNIERKQNQRKESYSFMKDLVLCVRKEGFHVSGEEKLLNNMESFGKQK